MHAIADLTQLMMVSVASLDAIATSGALTASTEKRIADGELGRARAEQGGQSHLPGCRGHLMFLPLPA
jgi:hypothetical protein